MNVRTGGTGPPLPPSVGPEETAGAEAGLFKELSGSADEGREVGTGLGRATEVGLPAPGHHLLPQSPCCWQ